MFGGEAEFRLVVAAVEKMAEYGDLHEMHQKQHVIIFSFW